MERTVKASPSEAGQGHSGGDGLLSESARRLTDALVGARRLGSRLLGRAQRDLARALGELRDVGEDVASLLDPGPWLEQLYAALGIASTGALEELDERIDDLEIKIDDVARRRAREELLLLQERIVALEELLSSRGVEAAHQSLARLLERLGELERRIDALPWQGIEKRRLHPNA